MSILSGQHLSDFRFLSNVLLRNTAYLFKSNGPNYLRGEHNDSRRHLITQIKNSYPAPT